MINKLTEPIIMKYFQAIEKQNMDEIKALVTFYGATLLLEQNNEGNNIFHILCRSSISIQYLKQLILEKDCNDLFSLNNYVECIKKALSNHNNNGNTPLAEGIEYLSSSAQKRLIKFLIEEARYVDPNQDLNNAVGYIENPERHNLQGMNLLHYLCILDSDYKKVSGQKKSQKVTLNDLPYISKLLENFADVELNKPCQNAKYWMRSPASILGSKYNEYKQLIEDRMEYNSDTESSTASSYAYTEFMDEMLDDLPKKFRSKYKVTEEELIELNKEYDPAGITNISDNYVVAHFSGYPFFKEMFTHLQRREYGTSPEHKGKHLHSEATYVNSNILPNSILTKDHDDSLLELDLQLGEALSQLKITKTKIQAKKAENTFSIAMQAYVNTFCKNPSNFFDHVENPIKQELENFILTSSPIVSASKTPEHAFKFAIAHFENDKTKIIDPEYSKSGIPKHRLPGVIFISLHSLSEYTTENKADITQMIKTKEISPKARLHAQLEVSFLGGITKAPIATVIPVVFPNLSKKHTREVKNESIFYQEIFNDVLFTKKNEISKAAGSPEKFRQYIKKNIDEDYVGKYCAGKEAYNGGIIDKLKQAYVKICLKIALNIAAEQDKKLVYVDAEGKVCAYDYSDIKLYEHITPDVSPWGKIDTQINHKDKYNLSLEELDNKNWHRITPLKQSTCSEDFKIEYTEAVRKTLFKEESVIEQDNHWYSNDEITAILTHKFNSDNQNISIAPIIQLENVELFQQIITSEIDKISDNQYESSVLPIQIHDNHWVGFVIKKNANHWQVIYNDPLGHSIQDEPAIEVLIKHLTEIIGEGFTVYDLKTKQQNNGYDCGPFTVDNLYKLSIANTTNLKMKAIKKLLVVPQNGDATTIRQEHFNFQIYNAPIKTNDEKNTNSIFPNEHFDSCEKILETDVDINVLGKINDLG